jgi:secreted trypsin-like serine protease
VGFTGIGFVEIASLSTITAQSLTTLSRVGGVQINITEKIADPSVWPISAVGVVTVALFSHKMNCTGTLVAAKLVLTAAHCLFNGKLLVNSGNVRFLAGLYKGVPAAHADAKRLVVPKEFSPGL